VINKVQVKLPRLLHRQNAINKIREFILNSIRKYDYTLYPIHRVLVNIVQALTLKEKILSKIYPWKISLEDRYMPLKVLIEKDVSPRDLESATKCLSRGVFPVGTWKVPLSTYLEERFP
jgi:hypothetical protein